MLIKKPILTKDASNVKIQLEIETGCETLNLWYSVNQSYESYLTYDIADAYIVAFLIYAMRKGEDIQSEIPISESLYFSLTKYLIPFLCKINNSLQPILIKGELFNAKYECDHIGTGISAGVDSLSTIIYHGLEEQIISRKITTLTLLNTGYYGGVNTSSGRFNERVKKISQFCEENNYPLLTVDTNIANLTQYKFLETHTYLTCSTLLLLQKYFKVYYYSSGYPIYSFQSNFSDTSYYDSFLLNCISTSSLKFISSCSVFTRVKKTDIISNYPLLLKYLRVCTAGKREYNNCGKCEKCLRTILAFDSLGKLDLLPETFSKDQYLRKRILYISYMLRTSRRKKDVFYKEIRESFKKNNVSIPILSHVIYIPLKFEIKRGVFVFSQTILGKALRNFTHSLKKDNNEK